MFFSPLSPPVRYIISNVNFRVAAACPSPGLSTAQALSISTETAPSQRDAGMYRIAS